MIEGEALVRLAIESGRLGIESPEALDANVLAKLTLPNGVALPPSFRALLAYDASWAESLGWFTRAPFAWTPRSLARIVEDENIAAGEPYEVGSFSTCFLLPGGADSRLVVVVTPSPDALGEIPIVLATDDVPFLCVYMAGLDVFLGDLSGVQRIDRGSDHEDVARDLRFRERMSHHGRKLMKGRISTEFPSDTLKPRPARHGINPMTGGKLEIPAVPAGEVPIDWASTDLPRALR